MTRKLSLHFPEPNMPFFVKTFFSCDGSPPKVLSDEILLCLRQFIHLIYLKYNPCFNKPCTCIIFASHHSLTTSPTAEITASHIYFHGCQNEDLERENMSFSEKNLTVYWCMVGAVWEIHSRTQQDHHYMFWSNFLLLLHWSWHHCF